MKNKNESLYYSYNEIYWQSQGVFLNALYKSLECPENAYNSSQTLLNTLHEGITNTFLPRAMTPHHFNDRRFKNEAWSTILPFSLVKNLYVAFAQWAETTIENHTNLPATEKQRALFFLRQYLNTVSPSNMPFTNPEVLNTTLETMGTNLISGTQRLLENLQAGKDIFAAANANYTAFKIGENIAATPGKVVYQNDLVQLIFYQPTTPQIGNIPLFIIPAWINKFYIFDLSEEHSFVKWALSQGHPVFILSWRNPDSSLRHKDFYSYIEEGILNVLPVIQMITGSPKVNAIGYCLGGTLLACALGLLGKAATSHFNSATFLASLFDFSQAGDVLVFTNQSFQDHITEQLEKIGYLDGRVMAQTFNMMRANDLIWSAFVNRYMLDKDPPAIDFLYWNADSTHLPAAMFNNYMEYFFRNNSFLKPEGFKLGTHSIHLSQVDVPIFMLGAAEDHIAPWQAMYAGTHLCNKAAKFTLAGSGHVAGIINPPSKNKYGYWINGADSSCPALWQANAQYQEGSWWLEWQRWIAQYMEGLRDTSSYAAAPNLEKAPGSYVRERI